MNELKDMLRKLLERQEKLANLNNNIEETIAKAEGQTKL